MAGKESYYFANPDEYDDEGEWNDEEMSYYPRSSHRGDMYDGGSPLLPPPFYPTPSYYPSYYPNGAGSATRFAPSQRLCDTVYSASFYVPPHVRRPNKASSSTHDVQVSTN